jgi:hypothetical protein
MIQAFFLSLALLAGLAHPQPEISLFKPDRGDCLWQRRTPGGESVAVVRFQERCRPVSVSVNAGATLAIVWFHQDSMAGEAGGPGYPPSRFHDRVPKDSKDALYQVALDTHAVTPLPLPKSGRLSEVWIAGKDLIAATLDEDPHLPSSEEGVPALARAFRLNGKRQWELTETAATTTGWDYAQGVETLKTAGERRVNRQRKDASRTDSLRREEGDAELVRQNLAALKKLLPPAIANDREASESWSLYSDPSRPLRSVFVWQAVGEFEHDTGVVVFLKDKKLSLPEKLGYTPSDLTVLSSRGGLLLIAIAGDGTHPRLYDLTTGKLLFQADDVYGASFWDDFSA